MGTIPATALVKFNFYGGVTLHIIEPFVIM